MSTPLCALLALHVNTIRPRHLGPPTRRPIMQAPALQPSCSPRCAHQQLAGVQRARWHPCPRRSARRPAKLTTQASAGDLADATAVGLGLGPVIGAGVALAW